MIDWLFATLRQYPEIAIFLSLGIGYYFGKFTFKGIGLGSVTATLLAAVVIGQLGITINQPLKAFAFLMFLFAVGYGVGPQFVRGVAKDGLPQALFAVVVCVLCLAFRCPGRQAGRLRPGLRGRAVRGSRRPSRPRWASRPTPSTGWVCPPSRPRPCSTTMPVAYAVTYIFGTVGSAIVIALVGPALLRHRSRRRRQGLRGEARRRRQGSRRGRLGLAPLRAARLPGADRAGRPSASGPSRPRRWCPTRGSSSSASAARMGRSRTRPPTA